MAPTRASQALVPDADVAALGADLADQVGGVLERVCAREAPALATAARSALARVCVLETLAVARWIAGEPAERSLTDTREAAALLDELAARGSVGAADVELRCNHLADAILSTLAERAVKTGASDAALAKASSLARTGLAVTLRRAREAFAAPRAPGRDPRTGLPSPELVEDRAGQLLARARREGTSVLALVAEPHFSANVPLEVEGQAAVRLLRRIAGRLDELLRAGDTLGHLDEGRFVILAEGDDPADLLTTLSERVENALAGRFEISDEVGLPVRVSVRARLAHTVGDGGGADELLRAARLAISRAGTPTGAETLAT